MKTLITLSHPELRKIVFNAEALEKLGSISSVDWVQESEVYSGPPLETIIAKYDAVISGWGAPRLSARVLKKAGRLRFFGQTAGTVVPFIDISAYDRGVRIVNANRILAASTAELAFALMLTAAWNIPGYIDKAREGKWSDNDRETVTGIEKQRIGLIGLGEISRRLIRLLKPLNPDIYLYSGHCGQTEARSLGVKLTSLDKLLQDCRIVSIHSTLTDKTRGMIGRRELGLLQEGALLVNTARSGIVSEEAMLDEMKTGRIRAALDVFEEEPLPAEHPLLHLGNVVCSPHIGGFSSYWKTRLGLSVVEDLGRWIHGKPLENEVSREQYLRQTPR